MSKQAPKAIAMAAMLLAIAACDGGDKGGDKGGDADKGGDKKAMTDDDIEKADIPVEEDFEEEAQKDITADNLDAKVAELEGEIK